MKYSIFFISLIIYLSSSFAQYNCQFISKKTYVGQNLSGSWGYSDTINNKEYALVGTTKGLSIVDITTPTNPVEVKFIPGSNGLWRECQTWKNYAYITQDNNINYNSEGVLIYDLSNLPTVNADTFKSGSLRDTILKTHSLYIDEKGYLYLNGGRVMIDGKANNGVAIYDLNPDPMHPVFVGYTYSLGGTSTNYVHDCYVRNDTMYQAHIYNNRFTVWDIRNRANPIKIQDFATDYSTIHNMWLSDDSKTLFTSHEQFTYPAQSFDISDLNNITKLTEFRVKPGNEEILHNIHVLNDYLITSYYSDGLAIFDASVPDNIITIGYYDTQPTSTRTENGVWGAFGYYKSGLITLSDMKEGLFVIRPTYVRAARLQGTVRDTNTLQTLVGVKISFVDTTISATTTIDGVYKTGTPRAGTFNFKAEKTGYITKYFTATLVNGQITTVDLKLRQIPATLFQNVRNCNITSYTLPSGIVVYKPGIYTSNFILPSGRDSIVTTRIYQMSTTASFSTTFCEGRTYRLPSGKIVSSAGTYKDTIANSTACDSIITITLSRLSKSYYTQSLSICPNDSILLPNGQYGYANNNYNNILVNAVGCDSVITSYITALPSYNIIKKDSVFKRKLTWIHA